MEIVYSSICQIITQNEVYLLGQAYYKNESLDSFEMCSLGKVSPLLPSLCGRIVITENCELTNHFYTDHPLYLSLLQLSCSCRPSQILFLITFNLSNHLYTNQNGAISSSPTLNSCWIKSIFTTLKKLNKNKNGSLIICYVYPVDWYNFGG